MKTPEEKYRNDPTYHALVDSMESMIHGASVTPSEMREAAMLASIHYEMRHTRGVFEVPADVANALRIMECYRIGMQAPKCHRCGTPIPAWIKGKPEGGICLNCS